MPFIRMRNLKSLEKTPVSWKKVKQMAFSDYAQTLKAKNVDVDFKKGRKQKQKHWNNPLNHLLTMFLAD